MSGAMLLAVGASTRVHCILRVFVRATKSPATADEAQLLLDDLYPTEQATTYAAEPTARRSWPMPGMPRLPRAMTRCGGRDALGIIRLAAKGGDDEARIDECYRHRNAEHAGGTDDGDLLETVHAQKAL